MRLPATAAAIATWLIISRCVLPRVGRRLANNRVAVWTAGAVFLAAWLPFNNGLRPEPLIAFGALAAWMLIENAIATRRLWPAAVAIVVAVLSVTLAPQGLIALAPLLVGARAVARIIRSRRAVDGLVAPLATLAASLALIFVVVFRHRPRARGAAAAGRCPRHGEGPGVAVDRRNGTRAAAADVHADEVGRAVRRVRRPRRRTGRRIGVCLRQGRAAQPSQPGA